MKTRKLRKSNFPEEITLLFLELLNVIKLFHWSTTSYATHKATDELYSKCGNNVDKFVEVMMGEKGSRLAFANLKSIPVSTFKTNVEFKNYIFSIKKYLEPDSKFTSDLLNIRDDIVNDLNQFLYLLTLE